MSEMPVIAWAGSSVFCGGLAWAAWSDLAAHRIPNGGLTAFLALFVVFAPFLVGGWPELAVDALAALGLLAAGILLFAAGWIGAGDVKFAAIVALWLGAEQVPAFLVMTSLSGAALALVLLAFRCTGKAGGGAGALARLPVPYGIAISAGALMAVSQTAWFAAGAG